MNTSERIRILRRLVGDVEKRFREQTPGKDPETRELKQSDASSGSLDERKQNFLLGVDFQEVETSRGGVMVRTRVVDDTTARFGNVPLKGVRNLAMAPLSMLSGDEQLGVTKPGDLLFVDIETTSLALGAGNCVFLVGVAYLGPNGLIVEQILAREPAEEPALLEALAERLEKAGALVTFNGKAFDLDVLETRYIMNRKRLKLKAFPHLDLLHVSRRLYRNCLTSFRLQALEAGLLGCPRDQEEDIPGELVPEAYFGFIRRGVTEPMRRVINHNYSDVLAMSALAIKCASFSGSPGWENAESQIYWNLGRYLDRSGRLGESLEYTAKALELDLAGDERREAQFTLSLNLKRLGRLEEAEVIWLELHEKSDIRGTLELCKHMEHHQNDFSGALELVEELLNRDFHAIGDLKEDLQRRIYRLKCRMAGKRWY